LFNFLDDNFSNFDIFYVDRIDGRSLRLQERAVKKIQILKLKLNEL